MDLLLQPCLFENAIQSARSQIITGLSGYCNTATFDWMLKLTMATARGDNKPSVGPKHGQDVAYFHGARIAKCHLVAKNEQREVVGLCLESWQD